MGIIKRGILGGFSKSVANVVGTSWKGIAVMKSKPLSVANPRSAGQTAQRTKFTASVEFAKNILSSIITPIWNSFASQMSGYNLFISYNSQNLFSDSGVYQPSELVLVPKQGTPAGGYGAIASAGSDSVSIDWSKTLVGADMSLNDDVIVLVVGQDGTVFYASVGEATRADEAIEVTISEGLTLTQMLHVYISFVSKDGKRTFGTQWLQINVGA